jgi:hypothetical protein
MESQSSPLLLASDHPARRTNGAKSALVEASVGAHYPLKPLAKTLLGLFSVIEWHDRQEQLPFG